MLLCRRMVQLKSSKREQPYFKIIGLEQVTFIKVSLFQEHRGEYGKRKKYGSGNCLLGKIFPYFTKWEKLTIGLCPLKESKECEACLESSLYHSDLLLMIIALTGIYES